jgi:hypothetical protein
MFFAGSNPKSHTNRFLIFVIGIAMLIFGITYASIDITTTAKFLDGIGMQSVRKELVFGNVTIEAWMFGVCIWIAQIYMIYKYNSLGGKLRVNGKFTPAAKWLIATIFVAIIDTYTDTDFRSWGLKVENGLVFKTILVSFFVYNLFSEWAVGTGFRETVENLDAFIYVVRQVKDSLVVAVRGKDYRPQFPYQPKREGQLPINQIKGKPVQTGQRINPNWRSVSDIERQRKDAELKKELEKIGRDNEF